jgi:hypothetical protein
MIEVTMDPNWAAKIDAISADLDKIIVATNIDLWNDVVEGTPVDTGFARASWWAAIGDPGANPSPPAEGDGPNSVAPPAFAGALLMSSGKVLSIANSAAYIFRLEYDGWSAQNSGWIRAAAAKYGINLSRHAVALGYKP